MKFFTADTHFYHKKIIQYEKIREVFADVEVMNEFLLNNINETCTPDDDLYIVGDLALGKVRDVVEIIKRMNPRVHLISGNHDPFWSAKKKYEKAREKYLEAGVVSIADNLELQITGDLVVNVSHFPYRGKEGGDHTEVERYSEHRLIDDGKWLICGHVHSLWKQNGKMINVGVDTNSLRPVSEHQIYETIKQGPRFVKN